MTTPIIEVKNISKTFKIPHERIDSLRGKFFNIFKTKEYSQFEALKDVNFEIQPGEFLGIIGRNGSGKSTLLKILAGIYEPDKGKIIVRGKISPFLELGVGFNGELSARDNIYLNATILGLSHEQINQKFDKIIEFAELENFVDTKVKNFSSGMYARLAFSVAIEAEADIYLMDEVLAVGDAGFQAKCFEKFRELKNQNKTIVLVSHDLNSVRDYCDKAILLEDSHIKLNTGANEVINTYLANNSNQKKNKPTAIQDNPVSDIPTIKNIKILDTNSKELNSIRTGTTINFEINLNTYNQTNFNNINVGIGLYSSDGRYLFGYNTLTDSTQRKNISKLNLFIPEFNILPGSYYLNAVCFGEIEQNYYDFKPRIIEFRTFADKPVSQHRGHIYLTHKWKYD